MELKNFFVQDDAGNILSAATCYLYVRGSESLVEVLQGANGLALPNPFLSDQQGLVQFAAPNGLYDLRVVKGSRDFRLRMQCNDVMETTAAAENAARLLEDRLKDPTDPDKSPVPLGYTYGSEHSELRDIHEKLKTEFRSFLDFIPKNQKSAFKDGTSTWDASVRANYAIRELGGGGILLPKGSCMALGEPLDIIRGTILKADGSFDTTPGIGTKIMLLPGANCEIIRTPTAWEGSPATHFMGLENLLLDGNKANQTVEVRDGVVKIWGAWVGSWLTRVCILNTFGKSLDLRKGTDLAIDHMWIVGCTSTDGYAFDTNADLTGSALSGLLQITNLYVENTGIDKARSPKTEEVCRGKNIRLRRLVSVHIADLHTEGAAIGVDLTQNHLVKIDKITGHNIGSSVFPESSLVRHVESPSRTVSIGPMYLPAGLPGRPFIVRKSADLAANNSIPEVGALTSPWVPSYVSQSDNLFAYAKKSKTAFTNMLAVERVGAYSEQSINIFGGDADAPGVRKTYMKEGGSGPRIGTSANRPDNVDKDFWTCYSTGGMGDRIVVSDPLVIGSRADASSIPAGAIYRSMAGHGLYLQREAGLNSGRDNIVSLIIGYGVPTQNSHFVGQQYLDNSSAKRTYTAVNVGTGATDWKPITA